MLTKPHKHKAYEPKNPNSLPFVILVLFMRHHSHGSWQIHEAFNLCNIDSCSTHHLGLY